MYLAKAPKARMLYLPLIRAMMKVEQGVELFCVVKTCNIRVRSRTEYVYNHRIFAYRQRRTPMSNPLQQLQLLGQSVWYDNIDRSQLISGQFKRMLDEDAITGVTANPTTFEKSIRSGQAYDEQMTQLIQAGKSTNEIYEAMIITDIRTVADLLRPI